MNFQWMMFVELGIIAIALLLGTYMRAKIKFFQNFMIPNSITAGIILLLFYSLVAPRLGMDKNFLRNLVYHLLNISFVAMSLRPTTKSKTKGKSSVFPVHVGLISQYAIQGAVGMLLTLMFIKTFIPNLFPGFGFFIPMGFCLGPGQAFAIGSKWEAPAYGFEGAGSVGLTFGAAGFFWAIFAGVIIINIAVKKGWVKLPSHGEKNNGFRKRDSEFPVGARLTTYSEAIESFAFNLAIVLVIYLITYLFLNLLTFVLSSLLGDMGMSLAESFWGIAFIFCALLGMLGKRVFKWTRIDHHLEPGILNRTAGFSVDFMVAASIGAISIPIVIQYWVPILTLVLVGGAITTITVIYMGSRLFVNYRFQRVILMYGALTGTLPSGLTLLRVVDPEFDTPAANDYIAASAITFPIAIPYVLMADWPGYGLRDGNPVYYWMTAGVLAAYMAYTLICFGLINKRNPKSKDRKFRLWKPMDESDSDE